MNSSHTGGRGDGTMRMKREEKHRSKVESGGDSGSGSRVVVAALVLK